MAIEITESLFGHIYNDPFLTGTFRLEGQNFRNTVGLLNQFIEDEKSSSLKLPAEVQGLLEATTTLLDQENEIAKLAASKHDEKATQALAKQWFQLIQQTSAEKKDYLLLPGGWKAKPSGHGIIYQFHREDNGDIIFTINNSGAGIEYHAKRSEADKELYSATLKYRIPKENAANEKDFIPILQELIEANSIVHEKNTIDASFLYERVFGKLDFLDATILEPTPEEFKFYTGGQLSGTCAQRSIHQMLKARFSSVDDYRQFIFRFKAYALEQYMENMAKEGRLGETKYHPQIQKAIRHLLRLLNVTRTDSEEPLFSDNFREEKRLLFVKYLSSLRSHTKKEETPSAQAPNKPTETFDVDFSTGFIPNHANATSLPSPVLSDPLPKPLHAPNLLKTMRDLKTEGERMQKQDPAFVFEMLETFFLQLPLPDEKDDSLLAFYKDAGVLNDPHAFFSLMADLQKLYFDTAKNSLGPSVILPSMQTIKASNFAVCAHVCKHSKYLLGENFANLVRWLPSSLQLQNGRVAQLSNHHPALDQRLQQIRQLHSGDKYDSGKAFPEHYQNAMIRHYNQLLDEHSELKAELEEKFNLKHKNDYSNFIQKIRSSDSEALYYFSTYHTSDPDLKTNGRFHKIHDLWRKQATLEQAFSYGLPTLFGNYEYSRELSLSYDEMKNQLKLVSDIQNGSNHFFISSNLKKSIYPLPDGAVKSCFDYYINQNTSLTKVGIGLPKSAEVQLKRLPTQTSTASTIRPEDFEERELFHLRQDSESQILLTLEYFLKHPNKLSRSEMQVYCEANIFESGLLLQLLKSPEAANFWPLLDKWVEQGIEQSQKQGQFTPQSLFYVRLYQAIQVYAFESNPIAYKDSMDKLVKKLNFWINQPQHPQQLAELHFSRFLSLNALYKHQQTLMKEDLHNLLESYFILQTHPLPQACHEADATYRLNRDLRALMYQLRAEPPMFDGEEFLSILGAHHLLPKPIKWSSKPIIGFPNIHLTDREGHVYQINVQQGIILRDYMALVSTPQAIVNHPIIRHLHMQDIRQCYQTADKSQFMLEKDNVKLRFTLKSGVYCVEQQFTSPEGKNTWYELLAVNKAQRAYLNLPPDKCLTSNLPKALKQRETFVWKNAEDANQLIITGENNQRQYYLNKPVDSGKWVIKRADNQAILWQKNKPVETLFSAIEAPNFMIISHDKGNVDCELPRLNLRFHKNADSEQFVWHWDGKDQYLDEKQNLAQRGLPGLTFSDQNFCVLPVTRFLSTGTREKEGEYYQFQPDLNNRIAKDVVEREPEKDQPSFIQPKIWQHQKSVQTMVIKMKEGEPYPENPVQALYLSYLYLGNHQEEKALKMLEACDKRLGGLEGSYEELQLLHWICEALPYKPEDDEMAKKAEISTPPVVACQLKALQLWAKLSENKRKITFPKMVTSPSTPDEYYHQQTVLTLQAFHNSGLNTKLYDLYTRYQLMRRDMKVNFLLSEAESRYLLNFYHDQIPDSPDKGPKAIGALGYDWLRLNIVNLKRELDRLDQKSKQGELSPFEKKRQVDIQAWIKHHEGAYRNSSKLNKAYIDLSINDHKGLSSCPTASRSFLKVFPANQSSRQLDKLEKEMAEAMSALNPKIAASTFENNFGYFLAIALKKDKQTEELKRFCMSYLRASRHSAIDKQPNNIPYLCNVLYRVICEKESVFWFTQEDITSLDEFSNQVKNYPASPIHVYQLEDKTDELLISAEAIQHSIPESKPADPPSVEEDQQLTINLIELFPSHVCTSVMSSAKEWQNLEKKFYHIQKEDYSSGSESDSDSELEQEQQAGELKYTLLTKLQAHARKLFPNQKAIIELNSQAKIRLNFFQKEQKELEESLLELANAGPAAKTAKVMWDIDVDAQKRIPLTINQLLSLYFQADKVLYRQETGLSDDKINQLHGKIAEFLKRGLFIQQLFRTSEVADKLVNQDYKTLSDAQLFKLGQVVFATNWGDVVKEPAISVFQYHENILLRPHQNIGIEKLLKHDKQGRFKEIIAKVVMGGGKSTVFSPVLAYLKANGENLVLLEVPKALLRTNYTDLKATSNRLFGQTAELFEFSRDSDCSPKALEAMFRLFSDVMVNKKYLVTTGDSIQSLELKFLEILEAKPKTTDYKAFNEWEEQAFWMEQLVLFLRNRGDGIIDEVHQGLLLKNRLNYTIGASKAVPKFVSHEVVALYQFFPQVKLKGIMGIDDPNLTMASLLLPFKPLKTEAQYKQACSQLVDALLKQEQSPLLAVLKRGGGTLNPIEIKQLKAYFNDESDAIPPFLLKLPEDLQDIVVLYKEEANHLLPFTLKRNTNEHYGPSKNPEKSSAQQAVAIPYRANNAPNEHSNFGNEIESINYTIQSMLINGVSEALLKQYLQFLLHQAKVDADEHKKDSVDDTVSGFLFKSMTKGQLLSNLDLDNAEQISQLFKTMAKNESFIYEVLKTQVLPTIRMNTRILSSNALNHVDILHSVQGYSGTPYNASTYHHRLKYERSLAVGTDGYIIECLKKKKTPVKTLDFSIPETLVDNVLGRYSAADQLRAVIDISAAFKGIANESVAKQLAQYIEGQPDKFNQPDKIKYVLYFNEHDQLSAMTVDNEGKPPKIVMLGSTNPKIIADKLGCSPDACFTYYDQAHTLGTDIRQSEKAKAAVLCDQDTGISAFLQGDLRMRDVLDGQQTLDIFVPNEMAEMKDDLAKLCLHMQEQEQAQLRKDNYIAAQYKMANFIRNDLLMRIISHPGSPEEKADLFQQFRKQFIDEQKERLFYRFGGVAKMDDTRKLLETEKKVLMHNWEKMLKKAKLEASSTEQEKISKKMDKVIEQTCQPNVCDEKQLSPDKEEAMEVELFTQVEKEDQRLTEQFDPSHEPSKYAGWYSPLSGGLEYKNLNQIVASASPAYAPKFSYKILASKNFYRIYQGQSNYLTQTMFPVHGIYFYENKGKLHSILLSPEELTDVKQHIAKNPSEKHWVSTTSETVLAGTMPEGIKKNAKYQSMLEQIRFFAGDFDELVSRKSPILWLSEDTGKKLDFFDTYLAPARESNPTHTQQLRLGMMTLGKMMKYVAENPTRNYTDFDWKSHFPTAEDSEVEDMKQVVKAFYDLAGSWWNNQLTAEELVKKYNLSPMALGYLSQYQNSLKDDHFIFNLKALIATLTYRSAISDFKGADNKLLHSIIDMAFTESEPNAKIFIEELQGELLPASEMGNLASLLGLKPDAWISPNPLEILPLVLASCQFLDDSHFQKLITHIPSHPKVSYRLLSQYRNLKNVDNLLSLIKAIAKLPPTEINEIFDPKDKHRSLPEVLDSIFLRELLPDKIDLVVKTISDHFDINYQRRLFNYLLLTPAISIAGKIFKHSNDNDILFEATKSKMFAYVDYNDIRTKILDEKTDPRLIEQISLFDFSKSDKRFVEDMLNYPHITQSIYQNIMKHGSDKDQLLYGLQDAFVKWMSAQSINEMLKENSATTHPDVQSRIVTLAKEHLNLRAVITTLVASAPSDILKQLYGNEEFIPLTEEHALSNRLPATFDSEAIALLLSKTQNLTLVTTLIQSPDFVKIDKVNLMLACAIPKLGNDEILMIVQHPHFDEDVLLTLCNHHSLTEGSLQYLGEQESVLSKLSKESTFHALIKQNNLLSNTATELFKHMHHRFDKATMDFIERFQSDTPILLSCLALDGVDLTLKRLLNNPENRTSIMVALKNLLTSSHNLSSDLIDKLAELPYLTNPCRDAILKHQNTSEMAIDRLINPINDTEELGKIVTNLAYYGNHDNLINALLKNTALSSDQIYQIMKLVALTGSQIITIAGSKHCDESMLLNLANHANTPESCATICKHPHFNETVLLALLKKQAFDSSKLHAIIATEGIDDHLRHLASNEEYRDTIFKALATLLSDPKLEAKYIHQIARFPNLDQSCKQIIVWHPNTTDESLSLLCKQETDAQELYGMVTIIGFARDKKKVTDLLLDNDHLNSKMLVELIKTTRLDASQRAKICSLPICNTDALPFLIEQAESAEELIQFVENDAFDDSLLIPILNKAKDIDAIKPVIAHLKKHNQVNASKLIQAFQSKPHNKNDFSLLTSFGLDTISNDEYQYLMQYTPAEFYTDLVLIPHFKNYYGENTARADAILQHLIKNAPSVSTLESILTITADITLTSETYQSIVLHPFTNQSVLNRLEKKDPKPPKEISTHLACYHQYELLVKELKALHEIAEEEANSEEISAEAKKAALDLYQEINQAATDLVDKNKGLIDQQKIKIFKDSCENALGNKTRINHLKEHPQFWYRISPIIRNILGVIAAILIIPGLLVQATSKQGYRHVFFSTPETKGGEKLKAIQDNISEITKPSA
ncbi:DUF3638 domain-containing protein [Legionella sp. W05-934-2]|uniref:DUF3638 domain-containing protein n=1 Tax=Legionella sp. W05-934-2 TaxID=1198649 RepID=UPI0034637C30